MSASSGGTTWWRCTTCQNVQGTPAAPPPPPMPAVAPRRGPGPAASPEKKAPHEPTTRGTSSVASGEVRSPGHGSGSGHRAESPHETTSTVEPPNGCGVCGSSDVQYVLETEVGVDAATLAKGHVVRAVFCSIECLAEKLGLISAMPDG